MKITLFIHNINRYHPRIIANANADEEESTFLITIIKKSYLANAAIFPRV